MRGHVEQFKEAMRAAGIEPPDTIEPTNGIGVKRFSTSGKRGDDAGWYIFHDDGIPAGAFGCWRTGESGTWSAKPEKNLTPEERRANAKRIAEARAAAEAEQCERRERAKAQAVEIWKRAAPVEAHDYLGAKGIQAHGVRLYRGPLVLNNMRCDGSLIIPARDSAGQIHTLEFINPTGEKRFLTGGRVAGCYFSIGTTQGAAALCIAEGFATGVTIHEATGYPVAVAFNAGNLATVATVMRERFAELPLILCADDDATTPGNPGLTRAREAARAVRGLVAVPDFGAKRQEGQTDFNDMAALHGLEAVGRAIANAKATGQGNGSTRQGQRPSGRSWGAHCLPASVRRSGEADPLAVARAHCTRQGFDVGRQPRTRKKPSHGEHGGDCLDGRLLAGGSNALRNGERGRLVRRG